MTLEKALEQEENLREFLEQDDEASEIWAMALQLEGVSRNCGKHAGGVVIAPTEITDSLQSTVMSPVAVWLPSLTRMMWRMPGWSSLTSSACVP